LTGHDGDTIIVTPTPAAVPGGEKKGDTVVVATKGKDGAADEDDGDGDVDEDNGYENDGTEEAVDDAMAAMAAAGAMS
jgi:hypothetical protein